MDLLIEKLGNISSITDAIRFYWTCKGYSMIIGSILQPLALVLIIYCLCKIAWIFIDRI